MSNESPLTKVVDNFIEGMTNASTLWGISKVAAQIFAYLQSHTEPVSLNQIVDDLMISKGNISVNVKKLEEMGSVRKIWVKGDRKDYYIAEDDFFKFTHKLIKHNYIYDINSSSATMTNTINELQDTIKLCSREESDRARDFMQKLQNLKVYYTFLNETIQELNQLEPTEININMLRNIWNQVKQTLKRKL